MTPSDWEGLPGADLILRGLDALARGELTAEALLVLIGAPRLRSNGVPVPEAPAVDLPEHRLYELLSGSEGAAAHSRYNALIRRLVSFERALESRRSRNRGA